MNAVSQALRIIAIVAALAAAGIYFLSEKKSQAAKQQAATVAAQLTAAQKTLADAKAEAAATEQDKQKLTTELEDQKTKDSGYETLLAQARSDASTATQAAQAKDTQIQDLNTQIATLKQQAASVDDLKAQVAALQAKAEAAPTTPAANTTTATTTVSTDTGNTTTAPTAPVAPVAPTFSTTPVPTKILQLNPSQGLVVIGTGSNGGLVNDAQLSLQNAGTQLVQVQVTDAEPDFSVAMIMSGSSPKQISKGQTVDYVRIH